MVVALAAVLALPARVWAQKTSPAELVRVAVQNELKDDEQTHLYSWKELQVHGNTIRVSREVQTSRGVLRHLLTINGKPLEPKQQRAEEERLAASTSPDALNQELQSEQEDDARTRKMLSAIPNAFDFNYMKTSKAENGDTLVTLNFTPRPDFNPPNRETKVFTGMSGNLVVDETAKRLVKVDGTLFKDVDFGWGIFGRLYKGGEFLIEKTEITPAHWDTSRQVLRFDGRILIFKSLHINVNETDWDYQKVPPMTVEQAVAYLTRKEPTENATLPPSAMSHAAATDHAAASDRPAESSPAAR